MKKWAFVSDFDGTISKQDFYWMVIDKYFPEGRELFKKWKSGELKDIEFLGTVFASINQSEQKSLMTSIPYRLMNMCLTSFSMSRKAAATSTF